MKKSFVLFTLLAVVVFAFGFTSCKQEAETESGNPFIGTWISTNGVFKIVFTETTFTIAQLNDGTFIQEGAGFYVYNGNSAELSLPDGSMTGNAVISGNTLVITGDFVDGSIICTKQ